MDRIIEKFFKPEICGEIPGYPNLEGLEPLHSVFDIAYAVENGDEIIQCWKIPGICTRTLNTGMANGVSLDSRTIDLGFFFMISKKGYFISYNLERYSLIYSSPPRYDITYPMGVSRLNPSLRLQPAFPRWIIEDTETIIGVKQINIIKFLVESFLSFMDEAENVALGLDIRNPYGMGPKPAKGCVLPLSPTLPRLQEHYSFFPTINTEASSSPLFHLIFGPPFLMTQSIASLNLNKSQQRLRSHQSQAVSKRNEIMLKKVKDVAERQIGLNKREVGLNLRQGDLNKKEQTLKQIQRGLTQRQQTLNQRQRTLTQRQSSITSAAGGGEHVKKYRVVSDRQFAQRISSLPIPKSTDRIRNIQGRSLEEIFWYPHHGDENYLYLFHGTDSLSRRGIQLQGIKIDRAVNIVYGQGFYLTPDATEALRYADSRFRQRRPSTSCMSPIILVFRISKKKAVGWVGGRDFKMKTTPPYYIVLTNQAKASDLELVEVLFLEERCA